MNFGIRRTDNQVKQAQTKTPKKTEAEKTVSTPKDEVSVGRKIAKGAGTIVLGTAMTAVYGTGKGLVKGARASSKSAIDGVELGGFQKDGIIKNAACAGLHIAPVLGAAAAFTMGVGPVGMVVAGLIMPGAIAGTASGVTGALEGFGKGINFALKASDKADKAVANRLGKVAGKVAKFASGVALGVVSAPVGAVLHAFGKGFKFAEKAIGVKTPPENTGDVIGNVVSEGAIGAAYVGGALSGASLLGAATAAGSSAGSLATGVKGASAGIEGFYDGAKKSYKLAGKAMDKLFGDAANNQPAEKPEAKPPQKK